MMVMMFLRERLGSETSQICEVSPLSPLIQMVGVIFHLMVERFLRKGLRSETSQMR